MAVCLPLLAVRLAYSLSFIITSNMKFNAIKGDPTAYLTMTMLPEALIITVCTFVIQVNLLSLREMAPKGDAENQETIPLER